MGSRLARLVCRVRGHDTILVFDRAHLVDADPLRGYRFAVCQSHRECRRCHRSVTDGDAVTPFGVRT